MSQTAISRPAIPETRQDEAMLHTLRAQSLHEAQDYPGAIAAADAALQVNPGDHLARITRAAALQALCRFDDAAQDFAVLAEAMPGRVAILTGLGTALAEAGRFDAAIEALTAAVAAAPTNAKPAAALGAVCARAGRTEAAITACRYALSLDPHEVTAHQNLAALLPPDDLAASLHRDAAYRQRPIVTIAGPPSAPKVLVLTCAVAANTPLDHLLPRQRYTQTRWFIDYAEPDQHRTLPPHDLVFNAIGDPDLMPAIAPAVQSTLDAATRPILNPPCQVQRTHRADLPTLLAGIADVVVPVVSRISRNDRTASWRTCHRLPVIVRPTGSHGGHDLVHAATEPAATASIARHAENYVTDFHDYRSAQDGLYRKYRVIFVDRIAYPYHLAIGPDWLVHYWTAGMASAPERRVEEQRFLDDPARVLGLRAMAALAAIAQRLDLDYAGIDFSLLPDGRVLVFEANATMLVHPETDPVFAYKNAAVKQILAAVDAMIARRINPPGAALNAANGARWNH